jgi:hypothetical protein
MRPNLPPKTSIRPIFSFSPKASIKKKGLILLFHVNGPLLYRMVFRAIHHVEKDQPPMHRTGYLEREVLLRMPRTAVRNAMTGSTRKRIGLCVPGPSGVHIWPSSPYLRLLCYAAVIYCYVPPRQKSKVPHELPFCGVVAGPLGDWLRV